MCSINHELESIFIHIPKTAGTFIRENLNKYHKFNYYALKRPDHDLIYKPNINNYKYKEFIGCKDVGIYLYTKTSNYINRITGMNKDKWQKYKIFCFVRNPYDRIVSAWNYLTQKHNINIPFDEYIDMKEQVSDFEYIHVFMPQYMNIIDDTNKIQANYIGRFENLNNDFQNILIKIGCINNYFDLEKKNNYEHDNITTFIKNQNILDKINFLFKLDFEYFEYELIEKYDDFFYKYTNKKLLNNNFFNTYEIYPNLKIFEDNFDNIKTELIQNINFMHTSYYINPKLVSNNHELIPIYGFDRWSIFSNKFPYLSNLIKKNKDIIAVVFMKLSGKTRITPHYGYNPSSNYLLRSHLGIIVPSNCGISVNNEIKIHKEKEWITFDDSKLHFTWNNSNIDRYILVLDLTRPNYIITGNSQRIPDEKNLFEYFDLFKLN